jgi:16S rRNA (adenine1518-N6/adenine1519-N6)-dimethyltransferase
MKHHKTTIDLLDSLHVSALKRYGQNFLVDTKVIEKILSLVQIDQGQHIIEIGPGLGALTQGLVQEIGQYTSYEIDQTFHRFLEKTYPKGQHIRQNFLKAKPSHVDWVVGNLPYYATTEIIEKIYKDFPSVKQVVLMVQREVFPRLIAEPGQEAYGPLAIFIKTMGEITLEMEVSPEAFFPEPRVQSVVFSLTGYPKGPLVETKPFFYFIKKMFLHRRKTILNNLIPLTSGKEIAESTLKQANIEPNLRPEVISVSQFVDLYRIIQAIKPL